MKGVLNCLGNGVSTAFEKCFQLPVNTVLHCLWKMFLAASESVLHCVKGLALAALTTSRYRLKQVCWLFHPKVKHGTRYSCGSAVLQPSVQSDVARRLQGMQVHLKMYS